MENFSYHVPVYVVTGGIDLAGHSSELTAGQVGLFDRNTFSIATAIGNGKELFFAQGNLGGKDWYGQPVTESHKSPFFFGKDVTDMYLSLPQTIQNEEWVIGFNGSPSSKGLTYEVGKPVRVKLYFHGEPIYRFFGGPKEYVISYTPPADCTEPCNASDCPDGIGDCLIHTQRLIDNINNHVELQKFGVKAQLVNTPYVAGSPNMELYTVCVCDNGESVDLQRVQAQYPDKKITRISRSGATSCYQFCQRSILGAPADFTQSGAVSLAVCGVCPPGSTLTEGTTAFYVERAITPGTDLSTSGARQTYADSIGTAYEASEAQVIPTSGVNTTTDVITKTAHGFSTGQRVTYSNGGGTTMAGLTTATDYYIIRLTADTFKVATTIANAAAGTAIDITGTGNNLQSFTPVVTASFIGQNGATATVKLIRPQGATLTPLLSDSINEGPTVGAMCVFTAPSPISWTLDPDGAYASRRTIRINGLNRPDCDSNGDRIADLTAILAGVEGIDISTLTKIAGVACADDYTVEQDSVDCLDQACLTNNVTFNYDEVPAFENHSWEVVPPTVTEDDTRKCGIRISAGYIDPKFGNCSFDVQDYYETMPIKMEVSLLLEDADNCDFATLPSQQQTRIGRISRQSGEWVVREAIMKSDAYLRHVAQYSADVRMREAFDINLLSMVDRNAFYKLYYVSFGASYGANSFRKNEQEKFTAIFAFKETDPTTATFETSILDVLTAKSGVTLHIEA